jgi:RNA polymerase sigma factor (sigma-70 family)
MTELTSPLRASFQKKPPLRLATNASREILDSRVATDAELLASASQDPDAFRILYERYHERLDRYFRRRTHSADAALELSAETFSRVWVMRERFRDDHDGSLAPWLFGIGRNVLLMSIRRGEIERQAATRLGVLERLAVVPNQADQQNPEASWSEGADELLDSLPLSQSDALRLRIVDEFDYDDVAKALGTSRSAARVRVHRGLAVLRERLTNSREDS